MRVPIAVVVPVNHYELLAQIARAWKEHLAEQPEDSTEYREVLELLTDWDWWDAQQRERGMI